MKTLIIPVIAIAMACTPARQVAGPGNAASPDTLHGNIPGPPALVYKTKADYSRLVPVILSSDKSRIVSYPHPGDLKTAAGYRVPDPLIKGYLLDRKGITVNVAFLKMTYEQYAALDQPPSLEELEKLVVDRDPLVELYHCGLMSAYTDPVSGLNDLIRHHKLKKTCKRLK